MKIVLELNAAEITEIKKKFFAKVKKNEIRFTMEQLMQYTWRSERTLRRRLKEWTIVKDWEWYYINK